MLFVPLGGLLRTHQGMRESLPLGVDVELDALVVPIQRDGTDQQDKDYDEGKCGSKIHNLLIPLSEIWGEREKKK